MVRTTSEAAATEWARDKLGFSARNLVFSSKRLFARDLGAVVVPGDLLAHPWVIVAAQLRGMQSDAVLSRLYPGCQLVLVPSEKAACSVHRYAFTEVPVAKKRALLQQGESPLLIGGCADQDFLYFSLQQVVYQLDRCLDDTRHSLFLLGRLLHGLALMQKVRWEQPHKTLSAALDLSLAFFPPQPLEPHTLPLEISHDTAIELAYRLAPLSLRAITYDLLGPIYEERLARGQRRGGGVFLTPPDLVDLVLKTSGALHETGERLRIGMAADEALLDPAAGTGSFLLRIMAVARMEERLDHVIDQLYAVESSAEAIHLMRLSAAIQWGLAKGRTQLPAFHFAVGDALDTYSDFGVSSSQSRRNAPGTTGEIADKRDFAYVVGNPPYIGESGHKELFRTYRSHPFWQRYSQGKMDFLQYFVVLALTKTEGREGAHITLLTSQYWLTADGAQQVRDAVLDVARVSQVLFLGNEPLFKGAPGHHSVVISLQVCGNRAKRNQSRTQVCTVDSSVRPAASPNAAARVETRLFPQHQEEWYGKPWFLLEGERENEILQHLSTHTLLGTGFLAKQGVAPGAQKVGQADLAFLGQNWSVAHGLRSGEGIFVLTAQELAALQVPEPEQRFLKPFIKNSAVAPYGMQVDTERWLIYLRHDEVKPDDAPALIKHLSRFRPLLERKREYKSGKRDWYHLHWPRDEAVFLGEKVITAQRRVRPAFFWTDKPLFGATDMYFIVSAADRPEGSWPTLPALSAILNSSLAWFWFFHRAKAKGEQREFFSRALHEFPLPQGEGVLLEEIHQLAQALHSRGGRGNGAAKLKQDVDQAVFDLYQVSSVDRKYIAEWLATLQKQK